MANRFITPNEQFANSAGVPYAGGQLFFYASGTSTPQNTYSDSLLTIPNANPVILDSAGRAGSIFLQNLAYKVVLEDVNSNIIWTMDPVSTSDFTATAQLNTYTAGNPNGHVAGTAGSTGVPASVVWDSTNGILYVCTTTGNAASAVWTAINGAAAQSNVPAPQGRLTLTAATPVISSDVIGATSVIYTAYVGNLIPVFNGASFSLQAFAADLTLTLTASQAADTIYDVFGFLNSGVLTLATGPGWSNSTAGTCARGTGANTTQLARVSGIWTNAVQITGHNGGNSYTIPANQATYLGTIYIDHTAGQVTCHTSYGQNRKFGVWNSYNRVPIIIKAGDSTASWTYNTNTVRAANNAPSTWSSTAFNVGSGTTSNGTTILQGLPEEWYDIRGATRVSNTTSGITMAVGIGINSTTAFSGSVGEVTTPTTVNVTNTIHGNFSAPGVLGITTVCALENNENGTATGTFFGTETHSVMQTTWKG